MTSPPIWILLFCIWGGKWAQAESVRDHAVEISATVASDPAAIRLNWRPDSNGVSYEVYRKEEREDSWGRPAILPGNAEGYRDTAVEIGVAYEYRVRKSCLGYDGEGFVSAGIRLPLVESRGRLILLVDTTHVAALAPEIRRLEADLTGDGWFVVRHDIPRTWSPREVKRVILLDYLTAPGLVDAVFLLGHIPVPYSGDIFPDGHLDHEGAWPADAYYGDMDGEWMDSAVRVTTGSSPRNHNRPGDGKYDPSRLPSPVELQVGRVDMHDLPVFRETEVELLKRYLDKNHEFRHARMPVERRGLVTDRLGLSTGEPFAASGWANFAGLFGPEGTLSDDWGAVGDRPVLWGYGCGPGTFNSCAGVTSAAALASRGSRVTFAMLFGSYFGDWDSSDNLLRALLASDGSSLAAVWGGRPAWHIHHMALGGSIGFSARVNQNNTLYSQSTARLVHVALMGDPTLRLHPVAPPLAMRVGVRAGGGYSIDWTASPDKVLGYIVYRGQTSKGPYERIHEGWVQSTHVEDVVRGANAYQVRAVKLEETPSGTYLNLSQGAITRVPDPKPAVSIIRPSAGNVFLAPADVGIEAAVSDDHPPGLLSSVRMEGDGKEIARLETGPFVASWAGLPAGDHSLRVTVSYTDGATAETSIPVHVISREDAAPRLVGSPSISGGQTFQVSFRGVPGLPYAILSSFSPLGPWEQSQRITAATDGSLIFQDAADVWLRRYFKCVVE